MRYLISLLAASFLAITSGCGDGGGGGSGGDGDGGSAGGALRVRIENTGSSGLTFGYEAFEYYPDSSSPQSRLAADVPLASGETATVAETSSEGIGVRANVWLNSDDSARVYVEEEDGSWTEVGPSESLSGENDSITIEYGDT